MKRRDSSLILVRPSRQIGRTTLKKTIYFLFTSALLMVLSSAVSAAEPRIAFVDATKVFEQSPQYEAARKSLEGEFTRRDNDLVAKQKQLKKMEEKLGRDSAVMSESEVKRLKRDILARQRKLKNAQTEFREDFNLRRNEEFNKLRRQVAEVVRSVGKEENIDLIISDGVVYFSKRIDISERVLERLRENFKSSQKK